MSTTPLSDTSGTAEPVTKEDMDRLSGALAKVGELGPAIDNLSATTSQLVTKEDYKKRGRLIALVVALLVAAFALPVTAIVLDQNEGARERRQLAGIAADIRSCTDPAGECAKRGQAGTGQAVARLEQSAKVSAICARTQGTEPAIDSCIDERMTAYDAEVAQYLSTTTTVPPTQSEADAAVEDLLEHAEDGTAGIPWALIGFVALAVIAALVGVYYLVIREKETTPHG